MSEINPEDFKKAIRADLKDRWKKNLQNRENKKPRVMNIWVRRLSVAAVLLLAISLGLWWFSPQEAVEVQDPQSLFADNFEAPPNDLQPTVRSEQEISPLTSALQAYEAGDYRKAVTEFTALPDSLFTSEIYLYRGIAYLALERPPLAESDLREALKGPYKESAQWYLALNSLKKNQTEEAKRYLQLILDTKRHPYRSEARDMLQRLPTE